MKFFKQFSRSGIGVSTKSLAHHVDQLRAERDSGVLVSTPKAFGIPIRIKEPLISFLSKQDEVISAFLVQITYLDNPDLSPANRPCLTLLIDYGGKESKATHDRLSVEAQHIIDGKLGAWGFIDILAARPDLLKLATMTEHPLYVKSK